MDINWFDYELPEKLIGQKAIEPRDSCRLMVLDRKTESLHHRLFRDLVDILDDNYVLVLNDTKVFPARLFGKKDSGGVIEVLLLRHVSIDSFLAIARGKLKPGQKITFDQSLSATVKSKDDQGEILLKFDQSGAKLFSAIDAIGHTPLPPYIHSVEDEEKLRQQYQTVYAKEKGSAAAPTAGLHFTDELLHDLKQKGVKIEKVTLHVGLGTFRPVTAEQIASQVLHSEKLSLSKRTADRLNLAKRSGKKIIAVGTTACRVLESRSSASGVLTPGEGETDIFIQPGYRFKFIDGLITNFHLPKTSLLMLVTALTQKNVSPTPLSDFKNSLVGKAYAEAVKKKYKFFSFGDAMLIL